MPTRDPKRIVVVDTTPIISLASIGHLDLLASLYAEVVIPPAVKNEVLTGGFRKIGVAAFEAAGWIREIPLPDPRKAELLADLGRGEAETLVLAQDLPADLVIIDERQARRYAQYLGFPLTGTMGVLLRAKRLGLVSEVKPLFEDLRRGGIRLADALIERALETANEVDRETM